MSKNESIVNAPATKSKKSWRWRLYEPADNGFNKTTSLNKRGHLSSDSRVHGATSKETLESFQRHLCTKDTFASDNLASTASAKKAIKTLMKENVTHIN